MDYTERNYIPMVQAGSGTIFRPMYLFGAGLILYGFSVIFELLYLLTNSLFMAYCTVALSYTGIGAMTVATGWAMIRFAINTWRSYGAEY